MTDLKKNNPSKANPPRNGNKNCCVATALLLITLFFAFLIGAAVLLTRDKEGAFIMGYPNSSFDGQEPEALNRRVDYLLNQLPGFSDIDCSGILAGDGNAIEKAKNWTTPDFSLVWKQIDKPRKNFSPPHPPRYITSSKDQCKRLKQLFVFLDHPLSSEEAEYPIAYGAFVYENPEQVTYMLSSLYRPNNVYVFMVDQQASRKFKKRIQLFSKCFPNVFVQIAENPVEWSEHEISKAVFESVKILTASKFEWKYYQYLSGGFSLPLKTNLEMVRIYKEKNGSADIYLDRFDPKRLSWTNFDQSGLFARKFYFDFEPAAYFCLYQNHWKRTLDLESQQKSDASSYGNP